MLQIAQCVKQKLDPLDFNRLSLRFELFREEHVYPLTSPLTPPPPPPPICIRASPARCTALRLRKRDIEWGKLIFFGQKGEAIQANQNI